MPDKSTNVEFTTVCPTIANTMLAVVLFVISCSFVKLVVLLYVYNLNSFVRVVWLKILPQVGFVFE
jgi:hypothetical protein